MEKYFLKEKDFIGGHDLNICDLIASATLEQSMLAGYESSPAIREYLNRCGEKIPQYHEILKELKATPGLVKKLEAKFNLWNEAKWRKIIDLLFRHFMTAAIVVIVFKALQTCVQARIFSVFRFQFSHKEFVG